MTSSSCRRWGFAMVFSSTNYNSSILLCCKMERQSSVGIWRWREQSHMPFGWVAAPNWLVQPQQMNLHTMADPEILRKYHNVSCAQDIYNCGMLLACSCGRWQRLGRHSRMLDMLRTLLWLCSAACLLNQFKGTEYRRYVPRYGHI